jgi:hypothetical protein
MPNNNNSINNRINISNKSNNSNRIVLQTLIQRCGHTVLEVTANKKSSKYLEC